MVYTRYGNIEELKSLVKKFHEVGIRVLGDVVLNHRCAHAKNQNGVWNIFGGRLAWDDRAVVSDDPHFQVFFYGGLCRQCKHTSFDLGPQFFFDVNHDTMVSQIS